MTNDSHQILWVIEHSKPNNLTLSNFIGIFREGKKFIFCVFPGVQYRPQKNFCSLKSNWDNKLLIMESYIEISPMALDL